MTPLPTNQIIITDGDFYPNTIRRGGGTISIELSGVFGGATVTSGYVSNDATPIFVLDDDYTGSPKVRTTAGRWITVLPKSGNFALRVTGSTGTTAILVSFVYTPA